MIAGDDLRENLTVDPRDATAYMRRSDSAFTMLKANELFVALPAQSLAHRYLVIRKNIGGEPSRIPQDRPGAGRPVH
ncbi:hypothetical protein O4J55_27160, partial [Paracoccus sp. PXZ]